MLIPTPHFPEILVRLSSTVSLPTHFQCRRTFESPNLDSLEPLVSDRGGALVIRGEAGIESAFIQTVLTTVGSVLTLRFFRT
jgi:hypothetical protein